MAETPDDAYERGHLAGEIAARLAAHDRHFEAINGSQATAVHLLQELKLGLELMIAKFDASVATEEAKAKALKEADEARRSANDQHWSPFAKVFATVAAFAALTGAVIGIYAALHQ